MPPRLLSPHTPAALTQLFALTPPHNPEGLVSAALALAGVFFMSRRVADVRAAAAATLCVAFYPVFVAEAAAPSAVMPVTALTAWGLFFYFPARDRPGGDARRKNIFDSPSVGRASCVVMLALACAAREAAAVTPAALCVWELSGGVSGRRGEVKRPSGMAGNRRSVASSLALLLAVAPALARVVYAHATAGEALAPTASAGAHGAADFFAAAFGHLRHYATHAGLWALTLAGVAAMFLKPRRAGGAERPRIDVGVQLTFGALVAAHVVCLPLFGADAARDALPVLPPVILVWVSTLWRRVPAWPLAVALACAAFAASVS